MINFGVFYQSCRNVVRCYMALQQLRKFNPDVPVILWEDRTEVLKNVADEFNCDYKRILPSIDNPLDVNSPVFLGLSFKNLSLNLAWLGRLYESCLTTLKDVDWVIIYEDDVWCKREIQKIPEFDLAGANGPIYTKELKEYLFNRFGEDEKTRGHWSSKGTLVSYQACGGSIFNRKKFIASYERINEIDWGLIYKLDTRPCEWSDASLSFIMQHAGFTCGIWGDWAQYQDRKTGNWFDKTGWTVPMDQQPDVAFIHFFKHFYNYKNDELDLAKKHIV